MNGFRSTFGSILFGVAVVAAAPACEPSVAVPFEGVQDVFGRNAVGDAIVVTAVRGPVDRIEVGRTYQIDGAYTLASHDAAELAAFVTGTEANEPHRAILPGQSIHITKGSGTFTVRLKVEDAGCPHVSFYPVGGGGVFAGEYFGTGASVPPTAWRVAGR